MGGSSGGFIGKTDSGFGDEDCDSIDLKTTLFSPNPQVISNLNVDDALSIDYNSTDRTLMAVDGMNIAGTILCKQNSQIINCIVQKGKEFEGIVRNISGGSCTIQIKSK